MDQVNVKVVFTASFAEKAGSRSLQVETPASLSALRSQLHHEFPWLGEVPYVVSLNHSVIRGDAELSEGDEIAFMPPFAGG